MLTCLLMKVVRLTRVWNAGLGHTEFRRKVAYAIFKKGEVRILMHVHS